MRREPMDRSDRSYGSSVREDGAVATYLTRRELRQRWVAAAGNGNLGPSSQPTTQPTTPPSKAPTIHPTFAQYSSYIEYVYTDARCGGQPVFISAQLLRTCYRQSSLYQNQPYYMRSDVSITNSKLGNTTSSSYTEIDSYYTDSSCTTLMRNMTLVHPTTSPVCSPLRGDAGVVMAGYYVKSTLASSYSFPSNGLAVLDYPGYDCNFPGGMPLEGYFFASSQCVFNRYVATCTGINGGPLVNVYDPGQGVCQGRPLGSFSLPVSCAGSVLGHAQYEITSGCGPSSVASFALIELFVGMVVFIFLCGCASCAGLRVAIGWRRLNALVVVDGGGGGGGEQFDPYTSHPRGMPHMTVHFAVPAEATLAQEEGHCDPDTVVAFAVPIGDHVEGGDRAGGGTGDCELWEGQEHVATPVVVRRLSIQDDSIPVAHAQPAQTIADLSPRSVRYLLQ